MIVLRIRHVLPMLLLPLCCAGPLRGQDEAAPAAPAAAAAVVTEVEEAPADDANAEAVQYEQMLHPKMWRELEFIKQTCNLTREQRPKIKAAGDASLKKAAKEVMVRMRQAGGQGDAGTFIRKDMQPTLEKTLSPEQLVRYNEELLRRAAARKKTTLRSVVSQLDGYLYLNREQRDKILQSLDGKWQDEWEHWLQIGMYGGNYFPMIPDEHVVPHLNDQQKTVWQGVQKINPGFWGGGIFGRQVQVDEWWDGKDEADVAKPEDNKPQAAVKPAE
jgi:hypothetical protein